MDEIAPDFGTDDAQAASVAALELAAAALAGGDLDEAETRYLEGADSADPQVRRQAETALESMDERRRAAAGRNGPPLNVIQMRVISLPQRWMATVPDYFPMGFGHRGTVSRPEEIYGWQPHGGDPMINAPRTDDCGGVVYFGFGFDDPAEAVVLQRLSVLMEVLGIHAHQRDYTVVWKDSEDPRRDGFLTCLRVVARRALEKFDAEAGANVPDQDLGAGELLRRFVLEEQRRFSDIVLTGALGGDGEWDYEQLAFGIMMENAYLQVYRIWSRLWLLCK
jgi:hypothetical protein